MKRTDGFTLIELIVGITILTILICIAAPMYARWLPGHKLRNASKELYSSLQLAKMTAIRNNGECGVVFNTAAGTYQVAHGGNDGVFSTAADNVVVKTINLANYESGVGYGHGAAAAPIGAGFDDDVTFTGNTVVFNSRGMINNVAGGYVYLDNQNNIRTYAVGTLGSGVILFRRWNGAAAVWD